jgi:hypothetical protein
MTDNPILRRYRDAADDFLRALHCYEPTERQRAAATKWIAVSEERLLARLDSPEMIEVAARALIDSDPCVSGYHQTHIDMKTPYAKAAIAAIVDRLKAEKP